MKVDVNESCPHRRTYRISSLAAAAAAAALSAYPLLLTVNHNGALS